MLNKNIKRNQGRYSRKSSKRHKTKIRRMNLARNERYAIREAPDLILGQLDKPDRVERSKINLDYGMRKKKL